MMMGGGPILFVCYGGGHIGKVAPVAQELIARGVDVQIMALTAGFRIAKRLGFSPVGYRNFLHLVNDPQRVLECGRALLEGNAHPDIDEAESLAYLGINYSEWVDTYGEAEAARLYAEGGRRIFFPVCFMGKVLDEIRPAAVVITSSPRSEGAATEAAVMRGIPSLNIMGLFGLPYDIYKRQPVHSDRITVLSEFVRDNLVTAEIDPAHILVTGCPACDPLQDSDNICKGAEFLLRMGWEGRTVVMYPGYQEDDPSPCTPPEYLGNRFGLAGEQHLRAWVAEAPGPALVVRYHPSQYHEFPDLGEQEGVYVSIPTHESVAFLLHASNIVVVQMTTVGLEAALLSKRVLCLRFAPSVTNLEFDYSRMGLAEPVESMDGLVRDDMRAQEALYRPTAFWDEASAEIERELVEQGVERFRSLPLPLGYFVPTYGTLGNSLSVEQVVGLRHGIAQVAPNDRKAQLTLDQFLGAELAALSDYRVLLAADDPDRLPALRRFSECSFGTPQEQFAFDGRCFSRSSLNYLLGLAFLKKHLAGELVRTVLEVGGGFDALGEILAAGEDGGLALYRRGYPADQHPGRALPARRARRCTGHRLRADAQALRDRHRVPALGFGALLVADWQLARCGRPACQLHLLAGSGTASSGELPAPSGSPADTLGVAAQPARGQAGAAWPRHDGS